MKQPEGLISALLDATASVDGRDDAAMDLADYDGREVEEALASVANDETAPEIVRASCGESLAEIWLRSGEINEAVFSSLKGIARVEAESLLGARSGK